MDNFEAARQALRETSRYQEVCKTEHVMYDWPVEYVSNRRRNLRDSLKIRNAYRRMDFLIRHALFVDFNQTVMSPRHVSALDDFIRFIGQTKPTLSRITDEMETQLSYRLYLANDIMRISHAECTHYGLRQAVGSRWFENFVIQAGFTMEDVVYRNPFKILYHSPGGYGEIATTNQKLIRFHSQMRYFWQ
jgi:hypothetical protein